MRVATGRNGPCALLPIEAAGAGVSANAPSIMMMASAAALRRCLPARHWATASGIKMAGPGPGPALDTFPPRQWLPVRTRPWVGGPGGRPGRVWLGLGGRAYFVRPRAPGRPPRPRGPGAFNGRAFPSLGGEARQPRPAGAAGKWHWQAPAPRRGAGATQRRRLASLCVGTVQLNNFLAPYQTT